MAQATEGFSGADLQALVYNAQLEVIHETISASSLTDGSQVNGHSSQDDEQPIEYTVLSGPDVGKAVKSRAEEAAFQRQVCRNDLSFLLSADATHLSCDESCLVHRPATNLPINRKPFKAHQ